MLNGFLIYIKKIGLKRKNRLTKILKLTYLHWLMLEAANVLKERSKNLAQTLKKDACQDQKIFLSKIA